MTKEKYTPEEISKVLGCPRTAYSLYEINKTPIQMPKMQNDNYYILNDINRNLEVIKNKLN